MSEVHLCSMELSENRRIDFTAVRIFDGTYYIFWQNLAIRIGGRGRGCERGESFNGGCQRSRELVVV